MCFHVQMPGSKGAKREPSAWVAHINKVRADMSKKSGNPVSYKEAMCAASKCWNKRTGKQFTDKTIKRHPCKKECEPWSDDDERRPASPQ